MYLIVRERGETQISKRVPAKSHFKTYRRLLLKLLYKYDYYHGARQTGNLVPRVQAIFLLH